MSETQWIDDAQALLKDGKQGASGANQPSRRDVLKVGIGLGFPAAVQPVAAQTLIQTPSDGLVAGPVRIPVGDFEMPAYRSMPQDGGPHPVILVISEIFGVHEHIADVTRRFARLGYCAIAPDLFVRQGDPQSISDIGRLMSEIIAKVPDEQVMGDLDATVAWAQAQGQDTGRLGITGWGGLVRTAGGAGHQPAAAVPSGCRGRIEGAGARPVRCQGSEHSIGFGRSHEEGVGHGQSCGQAVRVCRLPRGGARLPCGLSPQLCEECGGRRLAALPSLVQAMGRGLN
jgi:carboxymethylenebutenolidase